VSDVIDLIVSFPTVIFTVPLIFFFFWFLLGFVVSGIDVGDADLDLDLDHDGHVDAFEHFAGAMHLGALGLPLAMLMLSLGAWSASLLFSLGMREIGVHGAITVLGGVAFGLVVGLLFVAKVGGALGRALTTTTGAERAEAVGCVCKVRTLEVSETFGDAEVLTGAMRNSIIRVRAKAGRFHRGDVVLVVEFDPDVDAYWVAEIEEEYQPHR
jgi:hypothetical protein